MNPAHGVGGFNGAVPLVFLDVEQQAVFRGSLYHPFEGDVGESVVIGIVTADIGVDAREPRLIDQSLIAQEFDEVFPIGSASRRWPLRAAQPMRWEHLGHKAIACSA